MMVSAVQLPMTTLTALDSNISSLFRWFLLLRPSRCSSPARTSRTTPHLNLSVVLMKIFRLILGIFLVLGILMLLGAGALAIHTHAFTSKHITPAEPSLITTSSTVPAMARDLTIQGSHSIRGRPRYRTDSSTGTNPPSFLLGQQVDVLYLPSMPEGAVINSFGQLWLGPIILAGLGAVFCVHSGGCLALRARPPETQPPASSDRPADLRTHHRCRQGGNIEVNGRRPWTITAQWQDPTDTKGFRLRKCAHLVRPKRLGTRRKSVGVWIRPDNPSRLRDGYWVPA